MRTPHQLGMVIVAMGLLTGWVHEASAQSVDAPMAQAWPATRAWDADMEGQYSRFVAAIGEAVAGGHCRTLSGCLNSPTFNPLYVPGRPLRFRADCADVPYLLRAWFSYRHQLPFVYARAMRGTGHDDRYLFAAHPEGTVEWTHFATPRALFEQIGSDVHSGYLRTAPERDDADFYPVAINRSAIRPGTVFYDPNGHVLVVYAVHDDGDVLFFDGHPDNTMSHPHFSARQVLGGRTQGGGFKAFRPVRFDRGVVTRPSNAALADFGADVQYDRSQRLVAGQSVTFETWVRARLATRDDLPRPFAPHRGVPAFRTAHRVADRATLQSRRESWTSAPR